jgi:chorismate mutase
MNRNSHGTLRSAALAALLLTQAVAHALQAPKQPVPPDAPPEEPAATVVPTDETQFQQVLQRVRAFRELRGLNVDEQIIDQLGRGETDQAVAALSKLAAQGNLQADIALVRIQHWCNSISSTRPIDWQAQLPQVSKQFPPERAPRVAGVLKAQAEFNERARAACGKARFEFGAIESRLRAAADAGDPASATELAQFARDPARRESMLQSAIDKNYAPAMYTAAANLLIAVQRGQTTENVGKIRELLKTAGRSIPKAKLDLANCMAVGCDGEPTAFLSMARMPWGRQIPRAELLAWQYFGDRLNEAGCFGDAYIATSLGFAQTIPALEKGAPADLLEAARAQAETLWKDYGARARQENGCP